MQYLIKIVKNKVTLMIFGSLILLLSAGFIDRSVNRDFLLTKNMDIFFSLIREISLFYVDEKDPEKLIENGIMGVLEGLDPYTSYIPESEKENYATMTTGRYGGIGALIRQIGEYVVIVEPYENFPAQKSGFLAGDIILNIDGRSTKTMPVNEVSELLKGQPGSDLSITIQRSSEDEPVTRRIKREEVKINNVVWYGEVADKIGYIQLNGFTENANLEVKAALAYLNKTYNINSLILDVRGNPGGLLEEAVNVSNLFVSKGQEIVSTKGKVRQWDRTYRARNNPVDPDIPVVVLVGRGSASAAEIVAGAMQDLDRGIVIGQRTFGKGLIQATRQLSYDAQLKITTAKYYTPSGRCIQAMNFSNEGVSYIPDSLINEFTTKNGRKVYDGGGIKPDIEVPEKRLNPLLVNLFTRNHIFNFATLFHRENPSIPPVSEFYISDDDYRRFQEYLENNGFEYQTQTEERLKQLIAIAKLEQYFEPLKETFSDLQKKLALDKQKDFENFNKEIKAMLKEEIASRYYYQNGRAEASLEGDPVLEKAIELLENKILYKSILEGKMIYSSQKGEYNMGLTLPWLAIQTNC